MPRSIASRLFLSYLAVVVVGLAAAAITISGLLLRYENDQTKLRLEELSAPFLTAVQTGVRAGQPPRDIVASPTEPAHAADSRLLITTPLRRVVVDSEGTLINAQLPQPSASNIGEFTDGDEQWIFVRQQLRQAVASAGGLGFIVVARPRAVFTDTLRALLPSLALSALVALAFAVLVAALLARTITRPLRDLVGGVRRFAGGDYGTRVPLAGPSEVAEMGTAFNEMASEIQRARGSEQAFLADISHELRTPLTSIQGFAQAIVEGEARGARRRRPRGPRPRRGFRPAAGRTDPSLPAVLSRRQRAAGWGRPRPCDRAGDRASARWFNPRFERRRGRRGVRGAATDHEVSDRFGDRLDPATYAAG